MSKVRAAAVSSLLACVPAVAGASPAGPFAAQCEGRATAPALLVRVTGFKARLGTVRVQSYGGDPARYFDKGSYLRRVELPVPSAGTLDVCVPVPAPGSYAVSVRHLMAGAGSPGRGDGGGLSGNPHVSLFDLLFKRKPDPAVVAVAVAHGVRVVPVTLNYLSGGSFAPATG